MKRLRRELIFISIFIIVSYFAGIAIGTLFPLPFFGDSVDNVAGVYFVNSTGDHVLSKIDGERYVGDWICIDITDVEEVVDSVEICNHEVAHHLYRKNVIDYFHDEDEGFAEFCENSINKCLDMDWEDGW